MSERLETKRCIMALYEYSSFPLRATFYIVRCDIKFVWLGAVEFFRGLIPPYGVTK